MNAFFKLASILSLSFLLTANVARSQELPDDPTDPTEFPEEPAQEDKMYYTCETYTDNGDYKLSAVVNFTLDTFTGVMEILWVNESTYGELPRLRQGVTLNSSRVREGKQGKKPVFIVESKNARTGNSLKLTVPMKAEIYGDTMGELIVNGESFEVKCAIEIDIY